MQKFLIYNIKSGEYFESLLIAAVTTILGIRFYLEFTGYPKIGGGNLHIAHMLWGGLLMLLCIIMLFAFLNKSILHLAAIIGGIGFGTFVDEIGKFITSDNDYFFQPTFAVIYIIFILLFLLFRFFEKKHQLSMKDYLSNAFELTRYGATEGMDAQAKTQALNLLSMCDPSNTAVKSLSSIVDSIPLETSANKGFLTRLNQDIHTFYISIIGSGWFTRGVVIFFIIVSLFNLLKAIDVIGLYFTLQDFSLSFIDLGKFISSIISSIIVIFGVLIFHHSHPAGYKFFRLAVLFSLFVTQFFDFYNNQLAAAIIFIFYMLVLSVLNAIVNHESVRSQESK